MSDQVSLGELSAPFFYCDIPLERWCVVQVCTVFAQLTVNGKWEGPHVFVVRIRNDQGGPVPGVRIEDNGAKVCALPVEACPCPSVCRQFVARSSARQPPQ